MISVTTKFEGLVNEELHFFDIALYTSASMQDRAKIGT